VRLATRSLLTLCPVTAVERGGGDGKSAAQETAACETMVREQIEARGVHTAAVLQAMRKVPRHEFVPESARRAAYDDRPLPIGRGQTISQPYIVALMTELARLTPESRVLEVGTGSGYQAAILAEMAAEVYTIEIVPELALHAEGELARLNYKNVHLRTGDGYRGWPELAPFDAIVVTAAPEKIPPPLFEQLKVGGRLVIPVGDHSQGLKVVTHTAEGYREENSGSVRFVPMTGRAQHEPDRKP
jgi:protein-L-isoaspartate(D-aspartate) O-methyltransferase